MNTIHRALIFFAIAFIPSGLGAVSGIGGGIIIKPALDALSGLGIGEINFLSGVTVLAMSAVSLMRALGRHTLERRGADIPDGAGAAPRLEKGRGTALALGAALGGAGGKAAFNLAAAGLSPARTLAIQSALLLFMSGGVLAYMLRKDRLVKRKLRHPGAAGLLGGGIGLVSAFLGIGGGPVNIMAISYFLDMDSKTTALHSLYAIFLSQLTSLVLSALGGIPALPPEALAAMIVGGVLGGLGGSRIGRLMQNRQVDALFRALLGTVIALTLFNLVRSLV